MATPIPFIGCRVNLISKLNIRYEGILYTVDTSESTIALAKVQSFGTEDRPSPYPVLPRSDTYEYIIFRASDIKDLVICDAVKPSVQVLNAPFYDSAIVAASQDEQIKSCADLPSRQQGSIQNGNNSMDEQHGKSTYDVGQYGVEETMTSPKLPSQFDSDYDFEKANKLFEETLNSLTEDLKKSNISQGASTKSEEPCNAVATDEAGKRGDVTVKEDFYDKNSSFFDRISYGSLERRNNQTPADWRRLRETNQETFGQTLVRSLDYRRRRSNYDVRGNRFFVPGCNCGYNGSHDPEHYFFGYQQSGLRHGGNSHQPFSSP